MWGRMVSRLVRSFVLAIAAGLIMSSCAWFNDAPRPRGQDGSAGRLLIEPEGAYQEISCEGYREASASAFHYQYEYTSGLAARNRLCPISNSPGGAWRTSEEISIDATTDTVRLTASLDAYSHAIQRAWPVPPSLVVYCWDLTETHPGTLGIGLYHYGPPHDFSGTVRVAQTFNEGPRSTTRWRASELEAEAVFLPAQGTERFLADLNETNDDTGYDLGLVVATNTDDEGRISFDLSGWRRAVQPLVEECRAPL